MSRVYLDHNALSPLREAARRVLRDGLDDLHGNPSSAHLEGRAARSLLERAREDLADVVGCDRDEVVFTSGGTESNALALSAAPAGETILVAATDHPSLLENAAARGRLARLAMAPPGVPEDLPAALDGEGPALVSAALANHETGALLDGAALARLARERGVLSHSDASQALGRVDLSFRDLGLDLLSLSSHKLGGPVGVGALVVRAGTRVAPLLAGGGQEDGLRAGTEPALLAAAFAAAARDAHRHADAERARWTAGVAFLRAAVAELDPTVVVHTPSENAIPNTLCVSFPGRPGPALVHHLDLAGFAVSHGSACATGSLRPSAVLEALGWDASVTSSSLRVSLGPSTTREELAAFVDALASALRDVPKRDEKTPRRHRSTK